MDAEQIAREIVLAWVRDEAPLTVKMVIGPPTAGKLAATIATALRSAYTAGQLAMRERCAGVADAWRITNDPGCRSIPIATAIRSLEPEDVT